MNRKPKILIVDDDIALSHAIRAALEQYAPFEIKIFNDPRQVIDFALKFHPDLILMDVIMPFIDGGTLAGLVREQPVLKNVPVIFLTSILDRNEAAHKGGKLGNDPVLAKPVEMTELTSLIDRVTGRV